MSFETDDQPQSLKYRFTRFLSTAAQAARNTSVVISNQLYHNINPARSLSTSAIPRSHNNVSIISGDNHPIQERTKSFGDHSKTQVESRPEFGFKAFLLSQGPRALDIATEEEYRKHYAEELSWIHELGIDAQGEEHFSPKSTEITQNHLFERSVEKRVGTEELRRDWIRYCNKHGSRGINQTSQSPCSILLPPCEMGEDENHSASNTEYLVDYQQYYPLASGLPQPIEPSEHAAPYSIQLNGTGNILDDVSSNVSPFTEAYSPSTLSYSPSTLSSSTSHLTTPMFHADHMLSSPISPSPEPSFIYAAKPEVKKTNYFALYPTDHRLGFDCVCESCKLKAIKKENPDSIPTLAERRTAKRNTAVAEMPSTPNTPEDTSYTFSSYSAPIVPCEPVGFFMSGNTMVPTYNYKDQLYSLTPSTYLLGNTIVRTVGSGSKTQSSRKRARTAEISYSDDECTFEDEHGEGKRKRRK